MTPPAPSGYIDEGLADKRWARWQARGAKHDRKVKQRGIAAAFGVACTLAAWLTTVLLLQ